jgi:hypothetical protein
MSKLFKLKEWLTIEEAAKHLSTVLGEEVGIADIFRLALDRHLVLSASFPNYAEGNLGAVVGIEKAERFKPSAGLLAEIFKDNPENAPEEIIVSDHVGNGQFVSWSKEVTSIEGVWDLPMLASERIDVEYVYHQLIGGPEIGRFQLEGMYFKRGDTYCRLVESWDKNPNQKGSLAARKQLERKILNKEIPEHEIGGIREKYEVHREEYLTKRVSRPIHEDYYPAGELPKDSFYVVRTAAIVEFLNRINEAPSAEKPLSSKERNSLLTLIAALCKQAGFDIDRRGIAISLAKATEQLGKPLTDDTIRGIIKQVKNILS